MQKYGPPFTLLRAIRHNTIKTYFSLTFLGVSEQDLVTTLKIKENKLNLQFLVLSLLPP